MSDQREFVHAPRAGGREFEANETACGPRPRNAPPPVSTVRANGSTASHMLKSRLRALVTPEMSEAESVEEGGHDALELVSRETGAGAGERTTQFRRRAATIAI